MNEMLQYLKGDEKKKDVEGKYSYSKKDREPGSGKLRIGEKIKVRDDLYSMLFVSTLHAEYILQCEREHEADEAAKTKLLDHYRQERSPDKGII